VGNHYHIRYNTKHGESDLVWRVFENGVEHLVKQIEILTPVYGESTIEHGIQKWNIACDGVMTITDGKAVITNG
jgi:hypothetical protein